MHHRKLVVATVLTLAAALSPLALGAQGAPSTAAAPPPPSAAVQQATAQALQKLQQGDSAGALKLMEAVRSDPTLDAPAKAVLGALYLDHERPGEALQLLEPLALQKSADPAVLYNAARAASRVGQVEKGRVYLERAARLAPASPAGRDLGMALAREGKVVEAYALLRPWVGGNPTDGDARVMAASLAVTLERPLEAEIFLQGLDDKDPAIRLLHARNLVLAGKGPEAVALAKPLLANHPAGMELEVRRTLAQAYLLSGDPRAAVNLLQGRAQGEPSLALVLGRAQRRAGDPKAALATLEPLARKLPKPPIGDPRPAVGVALEYAGLLVDSGRAAEALPVLDQATKLEPSNADVWEALATTLASSGKKAEAAQAHAKAQELGGAGVRSAPAAAAGTAPGANRDQQAQVSRFLALLNLGRYDEARKLAEKMLASAPRNADFVYQVAAVDMAQKQNLAAEKRLRQVLQIEPNYVPALDDLAVLLAAQGQKTEARQLLRKALTLRPDDPAAKRTLEQLGKESTPVKPSGGTAR